MLARSLIVHEEEETIMDDGTTKGSAEDAPVERGHGTDFGRVSRVLVRPAVGVHVVVFEEPEGSAVEAFGSALGDHDDLASIGVAVLGGGIAADYAEFADGVYVGTVVDVIVDGVVDVDTIEGVVVGLLTVAVDEKAAVVSGTSDVVRVSRRGRDSAGHEGGERGKVTRLQRELGGRLCRDGGACARILRVEDGGGGADDNVFSRRADLEVGIHLGFLANFETEWTGFSGAEALGCYGDLVVADLEKANDVDAIGIRCGGTLNPWIDVGCGAFGSG